MKLWELLVIILLWMIGFCLGFLPSYNLAFNHFVPWLEVIPVEGYKLASLICAFFIDAVGSSVALIFLGAVSLGVGRLFSRR